MIQFRKPEASGSMTVVGQMKREVQEGLISVGMPGKLYMVLLEKEPSSQWLAENRISSSIVGMPTISSKNGAILYNFGGQTVVAQTEGRLQGNFFLPKEGFTVEPDTHRTFVAAKAAQAAAYTSRRRAVEPTDEELEAGESV